MSRPTTSAATPEETRARILRESVHLFASNGFDGVSMRDVARAVGVTPAALYYHFSDKEQLFLAALGQLFGVEIADTLVDLGPADQPWLRLENFILRFVLLLSRDMDLQRLIQWVLLDRDEKRLQQLADKVFFPFYSFSMELVREVLPAQDPSIAAHSVFSLIFFPFETANVRRFLPGFRSPYEEPELLAAHICHLLRQGLTP